MSSYSGGKNRTDFFAGNTAGTGLVKVTALTMVPTATAVTAATDAFLKGNQNLQETLTPVRFNKGGEISLDQDKYSGSVLQAMNVFVQGEVATKEYYTDGVAAGTITPTGTTPKDCVAIHYMGLDPDDVTKMLVWVGFGNFKEGSGAVGRKSGERIKPKVDFVTKATTAAMVVPIVAFDAALVTAAAAVTIAVGDEFMLVQIPAA